MDRDVREIYRIMTGPYRQVVRFDVTRPADPEWLKRNGNQVLMCEARIKWMVKVAKYARIR